MGVTATEEVNGAKLPNRVSGQKVSILTTTPSTPYGYISRHS